MVPSSKSLVPDMHRHVLCMPVMYIHTSMKYFIRTNLKYSIRTNLKYSIKTKIEVYNSYMPSTHTLGSNYCNLVLSHVLICQLHYGIGINDPERPPYVSQFVPYIYGTPLRCFVSGTASNVMMAGRCASFTHVAFGSQRVMGTCCVVRHNREV